jgi:hypothetical protein
LSERIIEDEVLKKLILGSDLTQEEISCQPHIVSTASGDYQSLNITNLSDIFPEKNSVASNVNLERNYFKVKVTVLGILPQNIREFT